MRNAERCDAGVVDDGAADARAAQEAPKDIGEVLRFPEEAKGRGREPGVDLVPGVSRRRGQGERGGEDGRDEAGHGRLPFSAGVLG